MIKTLELDKFNQSSKTPTHKALSVQRFLVKKTQIFFKTNWLNSHNLRSIPPPPHQLHHHEEPSPLVNPGWESVMQTLNTVVDYNNLLRQLKKKTWST